MQDRFDIAVLHAMKYEVGGFFKLTDDVIKGCIKTPAQCKAVGYTIDPLDAGGETKFGISKNANTDIDVTNLTWNQAKDIYFERYWLGGDCDKFETRVAILHFDGCVNHGISRANKFIQIASGVTADGVIGPKTLEAVNDYDPIDLINGICELRRDFYKEIVIRKPDQKRFLKGWLNRINEMQEFIENYQFT